MKKKSPGARSPRPSLLGAHVSVAGGISKAPGRGAEYGCTAIQVFTKSPSQWRSPPLSEAECRAFKENVRKWGIRSVAAHDAYLTNLASPARALWKRSRSALEEEVNRCARLGISSLVMHPGSHRGAGERAGIRNVARALSEVLDATRHTGVKILLETTAGQGMCLGGRFEHLAEIIELLEGNPRMGVCFDTCHVFAAGYDLSSASSFERVFRDFFQVIDLDRLGLFHLNDSQGALGSGVDRHEHIGEGKIGCEPFRRIVRARRFRDIPKIIETTGGVSGGEEDGGNLRLLHSFLKDRRCKTVPARL